MSNDIGLFQVEINQKLFEFYFQVLDINPARTLLASQISRDLSNYFCRASIQDG